MPKPIRHPHVVAAPEIKSPHKLSASHCRPQDVAHKSVAPQVVGPNDGAHVKVAHITKALVQHSLAATCYLRVYYIL